MMRDIGRDFCSIFKRKAMMEATNIAIRILVVTIGAPKFKIPYEMPKFFTRIRFK